MKETIVTIEKATAKGKKYKAIVKNENNKTRTISFGGIGYLQYRDSTGLGLYSDYNVKGQKGSKERRERYFLRHSGVKTKSAALKKERQKSGGLFTPKILSHMYLW